MEADDNLGAVIGQDDDRDDVLELTELFQEQLDQLMNSTLNIAKARLRRQHNERQLALTQICYNALLHKTGKETYPTDNRTVCSSDNTNTGNNESVPRWKSCALVVTLVRGL